MYTPSKAEFLKLAKRGNLIPVYKEIPADTVTPVSAFSAIDDGKYSFLFESVEGPQKLARYSFLGSSPELVFSSKGRKIELQRKGKLKKYRTQTDPIFEIKKLIGEYKTVPVRGLPRFSGGLVGYIGYDMVRFFEEIPDKNPDELNLPDSIFMLTDTILIFDHLEHKIKIVANAHISSQLSAVSSQSEAEKVYEEAVRKIDKIIETLKKPAAKSVKRKVKSERQKIESNFSEREFAQVVKKAKGYISYGDIIQVVLSQRFQRRTSARPLDIYRAVRSINPSPYMYYLKFKNLELLGSSPELLVRCEGGLVETRPIAGTRKRGRDEAEDRKLERELLASPKERAEHIMLVDLGRNDLGRVCAPGTVTVPEKMIVEKYSHVMHIVSSVVGKLKRNKDAYDVIRGVFPAGTVTGAPKVRAMEIIDELESVRRGPYAGCVGYFSFSGNLDTCITIRTIVLKDKCAYVQAGAGIVADSRPAAEYRECQNKAKALFKAIELAEGGLASG